MVGGKGGTQWEGIFGLASSPYPVWASLASSAEVRDSALPSGIPASLLYQRNGETDEFVLSGETILPGGEAALFLHLRLDIQHPIVASGLEFSPCPGDGPGVIRVTYCTGGG